MNAQGSSVFDTTYIDTLTDRINKLDACSDLKKLADEALASFQAQINAIEDEMAALKPIAQLLENPAADLAKIATWISDFIEGVLKPTYQPYITMEQQIAAAVTAYAKLLAAIEQAAERIGACVVEAPALVVSDVTN
ncbi:hypothetical protein [Gluconobacter kondonii]|uniref:hypothetical protein n=1 Tax=Gluconobacter kondonii TaxID=941463 RepID=UPI0019810B96|nr:hypothetical protein [Gluconobacter kondonii]MBN3866459.1 hypothetical protein [Gluconobacter kondonii]